MSAVEMSVVIPCLNEEANVEAIAAAVAAQMTRSRIADYEIIFIDNASIDQTVSLIKGLCARDTRVKLIVNNQNYGQMRSPTHAIYQTSGQAVIGLCADFQDPPELIPALIERWRAGAKIVLGVRAGEQTSFLLRSIRAIGYSFFSRFGDYRVIPNATGFGLYDKAVVDTLRQWRDPEPFFRGMVVESGFPLETIPYTRPPRARGETKNNFGTLLSFALSGLASSSKRLLRVPLYVALVTFAAAGLTLLAALVLAIVRRGGGAMALLTLVEFVVGLLFLFLGLLGEQVRLISEMVRSTPLVVEKERVNFPAHPA